MLIFMFYLFISVATTSIIHAMDNPKKIDHKDPTDKKERRKSTKIFRSGRNKSNSLNAIPENVPVHSLEPLHLKLQEQPFKPPKRSNLTKDNLPDISTLTIKDHDPRIIDLVKHEKYYDLLFTELDHINIHDQSGFTALIWAVCKQNIDLVTILLGQSKIDVNESDRLGNTALHYATRLGDAEMVQFLLSNNKLLVNKRNKEGLTPLHCAAMQSLHKIIDLFIIDPRFTFAIRAKPQDRRSSIGPVPHDLINRMWHNEQGRMVIRQQLDATVSQAINEAIESGQVSLNERFGLSDLTDDHIESIIKRVKSLVLTSWQLLDYAHDNFIRAMIISRIGGLTPHKQ